MGKKYPKFLNSFLQDRFSQDVQFYGWENGKRIKNEAVYKPEGPTSSRGPRVDFYIVYDFLAWDTSILSRLNET